MGSAVFAGRPNSARVARVTSLVHSTTRVFSFPGTVFSTLLPAKQDWTHPPTTQARRFEPETSEFIHVVLTTFQHLHRIGTFLAASWKGVFLKEPPCNCTASGRTFPYQFPPCYDAHRNSSYPLCARPFELHHVNKSLFLHSAS